MESRMLGLYEAKDGSRGGSEFPVCLLRRLVLGNMGAMQALWLLLVPVLAVGGFFLLRSFARLSKSITGLRTAMTDLADAGAKLNEVQAEVARLGDSLDEVRRQ